jgi:arginine N-succinyltransferase
MTTPYLLRSVQLSDLGDLHQLSKLVNFINLPPDEAQLEQLIKRSQKTFTSPLKRLDDNYYMFVVENRSNNTVVGCSLIHAQHGSVKEPHYFLKVGQEYKYSKSLNTGFVHGTLKLGFETNGYTEIGALLLHPEHRANGEKVGKQISFVRFLYMAAHPDRFKEMVHAELMPPLDADGNSPLWEAIGRRFLNMDYLEADLISRKNKEFILSLYPSNNIYQTLLPAEARLSIGKVGTDTEPVKKMLEEIGFYYTQEVDPFDGGPHYRCPLKDILPIKDKKIGALKIISQLPENSQYYLLHINHLQEIKDGSFMAIKVLTNTENDQICISTQTAKEFNLAEGMPVTAIPFDY